MFNSDVLNRALVQGLPTTIGVVVDNNDPQHLYRVRVQLPMLPGEDSSHWCRIATIGAGRGGVGIHFLPEVGDEVVVMFLNGDPQHGIVMGSLWNGRNKPAYANKAGVSQTGRYAGNAFKRYTTPSANDIRSISSRAKHELIFNDTAPKPFVMLHSGCKHRVVLNDEGGFPTKIEIYDGKEENFIEINTKEKKITIQSITGDIIIKAKKKLILESETDVVEVKSGKATSVDAGTNLQLKAKSNATLESSGSTKVISNGATEVKGSKVSIN